MICHKNPLPGQYTKTPGFTLAELLIALAILGVIAIFTIPKVLQNQQNQRFNSIAKEAAAAVQQALEIHRQKGGLSTGTKFMDLTPYLNYTRISTSGADVMDYLPQTTTAACNWGGCAYMANGGVLYAGGETFGGTASTNAILFNFDPDGKVTTSASTTDGPGKSVSFYLYYNGRLTSRGNAYPNTVIAGIDYGPEPNFEPDWFSWK